MGKDLDDLLERLKPKLVKSDADVEASDRALTMILKESEQIQKEILKDADVPEQRMFSFMPTPLTRSSPFFPMRRGAKGERPFERLQWEHNWGQLEIIGQRLSIYDESILLVILSLAKETGEWSIATTRYEMAKRLGVKPTKNTYKAINKSIDRLMGTQVKVTTKDAEMNGTILIYSKRTLTKNKKIYVVLNPYFVMNFADSFITYIDIKFRRELKGDLPKALYRFLISHREYEKNFHLLTLAKVINMNIESTELKEIRRQIRNGLKELRAKGFLSRYQVRKSDIVYTYRAKTPKTA